MRVAIRNYKSIEDLELELGRVTVLIGPPAAGKSNILEAIALVGYPWRLTQQEMYVQPQNIRPALQSILRTWPQVPTLDVVFPKSDFTRVVSISVQNAAEPVELKISYEAGKLKVEYCNNDITEVFIKCVIQSPDKWITNKLPKFEARLYSFDRYDYMRNLRFLTGSTYPIKLDVLLENGENLAYIVGRFNEILLKINNFIEEYLESKVDIRYLRIEGRLVTFDYYVEVLPGLFADGIWRMLYYVAALYSTRQYAHKYDLKDRLVVLIEEPDAHTFPFVIHLLTELIQEVSEYVYVVLTTHNGIFASMIADKIPDTVVYYVYRDRYGWTRVIKISVEKLARHIVEISDLLLMKPSEVVEKFAEQAQYHTI